MPAPTQPVYSVAATSVFGTGFLALLDGGSGPAYINIRSAADVLLAVITLTDPCGAVSGTTGQLVLTPAAAGTALADDTAAYGEVCDSTGAVHLALPAAQGTSAVSGYMVLNALVFLVGSAVTLTSVVVG